MNYLSKLYELGSLPVIRPGTSQTLAVASSSASSAALNTTVVRLISTVDCFITFGATPVAGANTGLFLPANTAEYFACYDTDQVAALSTSGSGSLYITPAAGV